MYICETCREQVRPKSESDIVYAAELVPTGTFGKPNDVSEGMGVFFHESCYPIGSPTYRRKPMPAGVDDGDD
jgi:hypothetical protein